MISLWGKENGSVAPLWTRLASMQRREMTQQSKDPLLLTTKLAIPPVRLELVPRPRLFQRLEACLEHPLTLIAAPAGFGKTVLLSAWARQHEQSVAWVSLDSSDELPLVSWSRETFEV